MQLTKLENAIAIGTILNAIGGDNLKDYVELESLRPVVKELNRLNTKNEAERKKEAITSLIGKLMSEV